MRLMHVGLIFALGLGLGCTKDTDLSTRGRSLKFESPSSKGLQLNGRTPHQRDVIGALPLASKAALIPSTPQLTDPYINTGMFGKKRWPAIAFDGLNFLTVWGSDTETNSRVYAARISQAGAILDPVAIDLTPNGPQSALTGATIWSSCTKNH